MRSPLATRHARRFLVPEVVQTSAMDCGPASLKCLLEGFRIHASYGRLREACQTDVDGTSIDTMEEVALQLGLEAEQIMVPVDHLLLPRSSPLPAIIVVRRANNQTHFLVAWRRHGRYMQLMDPATGRRWLSAKSFLEEVYVHTMPVAADAWREWAGSDSFRGALAQRLASVGVSPSKSKNLVRAALEDAGWRSVAALDAATRMASSLVGAGAIRAGRQAARVVENFTARAREAAADAETIIPADFWSARAAPDAEDGEEQVLLRGAVLVHVRGRLLETETVEGGATPEGAGKAVRLPPELVAALEDPPTRPGRELLKILRADGLLTPLALLFALALAAGAFVVEALMLRGLFDIGSELKLSGQRLGAVGALVAFVAVLLLLEIPVAAVVLRMGRGLETRLRMLFMDKIPRLGDRYFHSRLTSDMAERSHSLQRIRQVPVVGARFVRLSLELVLTTAGLVWLDPAGAPLVVVAGALAVFIPLAAQPVLVERDLRVRNHNGGLSRFYLDALVGLFAVRAHSAERAVRREHENLLLEWARAALGLQRAVVFVEGLQLIVGFGLSAWLLTSYYARAGESGGLLLFVYWVLNLPVLGQEVALLARQYPDYRNVTLRLLEPLGAREESAQRDDEHAARGDDAHALAQAASPPDEEQVAFSTDEAQAPLPHDEDGAALAPDEELSAGEKDFSASGEGRGLSVVFEGVSVRAAGHTILEEIDLSIAAGEHLAVVGSSGAGKSSLVGILLGWHRAATGKIFVGGETLDGRGLERLRRQIAWVDPTVHLWNRPFIENLRYGADEEEAAPLSEVIEAAGLLDVLEKLPDGLQTPLGEGGALVSGGQGQRVRLGRAMMRRGARLVILDEPFRGLERERRRALLARARELWRGATLICITHDVGETRSFDRVVVVHEGRVVEDERPERLAACETSRYRALLDAEEEVRAGLWASKDWRRLTLKDRRVSENGQRELC